jgi:Zn finger protein HypA/HybF involved in hydrogenase expression
MSPLSIPGTSIHIPFTPHKVTCKNCDRSYDTPKVKKDGNYVTLHCPYCKSKVKTLSYRALITKSRRGK